MSSPNGKITQASATRGRFGTFAGVFTPCTLTILGVIMFLRFGFVVGQAGLWAALAVVACAKVITVLTTLSLSAIATNTEVKGGGAYFLISRSLGVEFGGAIGLVFFLAQAVSVAMYVIGFAEAVNATFPGGDLKIVATATNVVVFICVFIGAGWTIKLQYAILAVLIASLLSFYWGAIGQFDASVFAANLSPHYESGEGFFTVFALFFPAVTGVMAGANMSGDLKDPARSIPWGTMAAVAVTAVIYLSQAFLLAGARDANTLISANLVMADIAVFPLLITAGVFAATLSSALGSMMGAPRILQAFARDNVFQSLRFLGVGSGPSAEPRRAVVLTFIISQVCILLADLNTIAPLITMFFMITYGLLNLATFFESITKNPSYRPRFKYSHWTTSLLGAAGCAAVMFLINWQWALISITVIGALHWYISSREIEARWGDLQSGLLFERTRTNLLKLENELQHPKNWRPIVLAMSGAGWNRPHLAVFGHWFTSGHGILTLGQVIIGDIEDQFERRANQERILRDLIKDQKLEAFTGVLVADELNSGIKALIQVEGLGALRPNTIILGWTRSRERVAAFGQILRTVGRLKRSMVVARFTDNFRDAWQVPPGTVDIWWRGRKNGELMLLLAHLLTRNSAWRTRTIRLLRTIENEAGVEEVQQHLNRLIDKSRISAIPTVIVSDDPRQTIRDVSKNAALTLMGFEPPAEGDECEFFDRMESLVGDLDRVVFVSSVGGMSIES